MPSLLNPELYFYLKNRFGAVTSMNAVSPKKNQESMKKILKFVP